MTPQVFEFLTSFPPHETITSMVSSYDISMETIFPIANCYKILYSVYALNLCLTQHLQNVSHRVHCVELRLVLMMTRELRINR